MLLTKSGRGQSSDSFEVTIATSRNDNIPDTLRPNVFVEPSIDTDIWCAHHLLSKFLYFLDCSWSTLLETTKQFKAHIVSVENVLFDRKNGQKFFILQLGRTLSSTKFATREVLNKLTCNTINSVVLSCKPQKIHENFILPCCAYMFDILTLQGKFLTVYAMAVRIWLS